MSLDDALYVLSITAVLALLDGTFAVFGAALSLRFLRGLDVVFALPAVGLLGLGCLVWGPHELLAVLPLKRVEIMAVARNGQWFFHHMDTGADDVDALTVPHGIAVHLTVRSETERHQLYIPTLRVRVEVDPGETESVWFRAPEPTRESAAHVWRALRRQRACLLGRAPGAGDGLHGLPRHRRPVSRPAAPRNVGQHHHADRWEDAGLKERYLRDPG